MLDLLKKDGILKSEPDTEWFKKLVKILTERSHTLVEMKTGAIPFLVDEITMDEKAKAKHLTPDVAPLLTELAASSHNRSSPLRTTRSRRSSMPSLPRRP